MALQFKVELNVISSYKRLAYTPWHAIAEFVDNSTQSFFENREILENVAKRQGLARPLIVTVEYELKEDLLRITDNAMGMSLSELERALHVSMPPPNTSGRSKYGMGLKTAACWLGNLWSIRTKKLGATTEYHVEVNVHEVASGNNDLDPVIQEGLPEDTHYTIIEIRNHNRRFKGRTLGKITKFLRSMYRQDFRDKVLTLVWRGEVLEWAEFDDRWATAHDGERYLKNFEFYIEPDAEDANDSKAKKKVYGWVGVLEKGSRSDAGFSIMHSGRVIKGWPDSWRPESIFGYERNDLINQRLIGEINLDEFIVSHTKDDIQWMGDQEEQVEQKLYEHCSDFVRYARELRKGVKDSRGPSYQDTETAISELEKELRSSELSDVITLEPILTEPLVKTMVKAVKNQVVDKRQERFQIKISNISVRLYLEDDMSPFEPYLTIDATQQDNIIIIVNAAHPHWGQLAGAEGVLNYLRHCVYDGVAEWSARKLTSTIDPDTIKIYKDKYLRIPLEMEKHSSS